jgi:uncharacterized protein (TIGR02246 family)
MTRRRLWLARGAAIVWLSLGICACAGSPATRSTPAGGTDATTAIPVALTKSAEAWNNADLAGHIRPYATDATFMGGSGPIRGRDRVGDALTRSFWRDGKPKQKLSFDSIEVRALGDGHALSTGHFVLSGGGEGDRRGWFSLTWERTAAGWQIVHDHSS